MIDMDYVRFEADLKWSGGILGWDAELRQLFAARYPNILHNSLVGMPEKEDFMSHIFGWLE